MDIGSIDKIKATALHLDDYAEDLLAAHEVYHRTIREGTVSGTARLSEEDLNEWIAKAKGRRGQAYGAGMKRLKQVLVLEGLDAIAPHVDMTPALAKNIAKALIGRAINRKILMGDFSTPGRTAANKSKDLEPERFELIQQSPAYLACQAVLDEAQAAREEIKEAVKASPEVQQIYKETKQWIKASAR